MGILLNNKYHVIISPIFFILDMEQIFRVHDKASAGVEIGNYLKIGVLGYADDADLLSRDRDLMSQRLTRVVEGSKDDDDMLIHLVKTKTMIVERQSKIKPSSIEVIVKTEAEYKHECEFCDRRCKTSRGLNIHKASCDKQHGLTEEAYPIERINAIFGTPKDRWYRVEWQGYAGEDTWTLSATTRM